MASEAERKRTSVLMKKAGGKRDSDSSTSTLDISLDTTLVCWRCTDLYTDPRQLPCGHHFCLGCLQDQGFQAGDQLKCPRGCPRKMYLTVSKLADLPVDPSIRNKAKEARKKLSSQVEEAVACIVHEKEAEAYCTKCSDLVCVKCMTSPDHRGHNFKEVEECEDDMKLLTQKKLQDDSEKCKDLEAELVETQRKIQELLMKSDELQEGILSSKRQSKVTFACENPVRRYRKLQEIAKLTGQEETGADNTVLEEEASSQM